MLHLWTDRGTGALDVLHWAVYRALGPGGKPEVLMSVSRSIRTIALAVAGAAAISLAPTAAASAHSGLAGPFDTRAICQEDRRVMARAGHVVSPCNYQGEFPSGTAGWYFSYKH
jgi:hypothetical protein